MLACQISPTVNTTFIESSVGKPAAKEFDAEEYYISSHYDSVLESLKIFANDELLSKPGDSVFFNSYNNTNQCMIKNVSIIVLYIPLYQRH